MESETWKYTVIGNEVELLTGFPFQSVNYTDAQDGISLLRGDNIIQGRLRWENIKRWPFYNLDQTLDKYFLRADDIVLAMDRPWIEAGLKFAAISAYDIPCILVQRVACLRSKPTLNQRFLKYIIGSREFTNHILAVQTGTAVPHISSDQIKEYRFLLPPLPEQQAIAHILGSLDDKIELNRQMNETLESIARALFKSWFVDFDPVRAKMDGRVPYGMDAETAALFPDGFEDSVLGEIPRGWNVGILDGITEVILGGDWGSSHFTKETPDIAFCIRGADIPDLQSANTAKMPIRFLKASSINKRRLKSEDIVIEISGGSPTQSTGRSVLITSEMLDRYPYPIIYSNFCRMLRLKSPISSKYVYLLLRWLYDSDALLQYENGTTGIKNFAYTVFSKSHRLVIPPSDLLGRFERIVNPLFEKREKNGAEQETLSTLRDTLLPKLLSGEIRVGDVGAVI